MSERARARIRAAAGMIAFCACVAVLSGYTDLGVCFGAVALIMWVAPEAIW